MATIPTAAEIKKYRADLQDYVDAIGNSTTIDTYSAQALAQVKRDLEDKKGVLWSQVYVSDAYLDNEDLTGRNADRINHLISLLTVSLIFRDYAIKVENSAWWDISQSFRSDYDMALDSARLDVDVDEDGTIDAAEESATTQTFLTR